MAAWLPVHAVSRRAASTIFFQLVLSFGIISRVLKNLVIRL
jgi:hypothetical protein